MTVPRGLLAVLCAALASCAASVSAGSDLNTPSPELVAKILAAKDGELLDIGDFVIGEAHRVERIVTPTGGPQLLLSDDPEYIRVPEAIALQETVTPGAVRLYVYNVNGVKEPKMPRKISAVIENLGKKPMKMRFLRHSFQPPSANYFEIGKTGLEKYFKSTPQNSFRMIPAGGSTAIDESMERSIVDYDELMGGIYEFEIDQPARISVVQTDHKTPSTTVVKNLHEVLPVKNPSGAGRGKFLTSNFSVKGKIDSSDGVQQLILADGKTDPWIVGTESTTTTPAVLKGNYGVMYEVELKRPKGDQRPLALMMYNARFGEQWCGGMAATIAIHQGPKQADLIVRVPSNALTTNTLSQAVMVHVFPPPTGKKDNTIRFTYSPPGASCLPTPLVFVPLQ